MMDPEFDAVLPPPIVAGAHFDVIVVGGGVGGCALGIMLGRVAGMRCLILEKDVSFAARRQGYGLTIQHHSALDVLGLQVERGLHQMHHSLTDRTRFQTGHRPGRRHCQ